MFVFAFSDYARLKHWHIKWFGIESQVVSTPELRIPTQTGHQSDLKSDSVPIQSGQCSD